MTYEESVEQLESLIEAWELDEAELNQTDINAMQVLLKEIQELELELSGYRQAILNNKEMLGLKEENDKLKKQLEEIILDSSYYDMITDENISNKNQQKEFIDYLEKTIEELECEDVDDEEMKGYLFQRIDTFKEILSKYKEIIGVSDDKTN